MKETYVEAVPGAKPHLLDQVELVERRYREYDEKRRIRMAQVADKGISVREIASATGLSAGTIQKLIVSGRELLAAEKAS